MLGDGSLPSLRTATPFSFDLRLPSLFKTGDLIAQEFEEIRAWSKEFQALQSFCSAQQDYNSPKNRYHDILPFDDTRVRLSWNGRVGSDYINASHIKIASPLSSPEYIACQAPLPSTFNDFWRMVWESNSRVLLMLTQCIENGRRKADEYWPEPGKHLQFGNVAVSCAHQKDFGPFVIRFLRLSHFGPAGKLQAQRNLYHIHHTGWGDMGVPSSQKGVAQLIKIIDACSKRDTHEVAPVVVHCSAGVGRAGTFIAIDESIRRLNKLHELGTTGPSPILDQCLDVVGIVRLLRSQRPGMVQTLSQYEYIYKVLQSYASHLAQPRG